MLRRKLTSSNPFYALLRGVLVAALFLSCIIVSGTMIMEELRQQDEVNLLEDANAIAARLAEVAPQDQEALLELISGTTRNECRIIAGKTLATDPGSKTTGAANRDGPIVVVRDQELISIEIPVEGRAESLGVTRMIDPSKDNIRLIIVATIWISAFITAAFIILVFWRAYRNQGDVRSIVDGASRFANGNLKYRIAATGEIEWDRLAVSMNRMARQLFEQLRSMQAQRAQQRAILESMGSAVIALDGDHRLLSANRAAEELFSIDVSCRGRLLQEVLREPGLHRVVEIVLKSGTRENTEFESAILPGKRLSAIAEQLRDADLEPIGAVVLIDDVTDIRRLERMRSDFAANVSHELKTPITSIQGYVETLQEFDLHDQEQSRKFLGIIQRNAERLSVIIEDLLTLARLEEPEGTSDSDLQPVLVQAIVDEVVDRQRSSTAEHRVDLLIEVEEGLMVRTRGDLLVEALGNLVSNAIRYGPEGKPVLIRCARSPEQERMIEIKVRDQGPGIPDRHVPRLFERFYRVDKARSRAAGGTGLGLAIVKHIALVHGGTVSVQSTIGTGSTFTLTLPMAKTQSEHTN